MAKGFKYKVKQGGEVRNIKSFCGVFCDQPYRLKLGFLFCYRSLSRFCGGQFRLLLNIYRDVFPLRGGAHKYNSLFYSDVLETKLKHTPCEHKSHLSSLGASLPLVSRHFSGLLSCIDFLHDKALNKREQLHDAIGELQNYFYRQGTSSLFLVSSYTFLSQLKTYCLHFYSRWSKKLLGLLDCFLQKMFVYRFYKFY